MAGSAATPSANVTEPTVILTPEQIDFYWTNGYLVLPSIMPQHEVELLRGVYDRLFQQRAGREGNQFDLGGTDEEGKEAVLPQILNPSKYAPEIRQGQFRVNALAVARQLLGPDAKDRGEHAIFKPAHKGAPTPWHQDEAYWDSGWNYNSFSMWIPLQPALIENGCMWFVPGSQKHDIYKHHPINHDPRVHGLEAEEVDTSKAVACPIPAGGCTIHHNRTLHYAGANKSDIPRRALILGFGLEGSKRDKPRDFYWNKERGTARRERAEQAAKAKGLDAPEKAPGV